MQEDAFITIAESKGRPALIICDRGVLDIAAYLTADLWQRVLSKCGLTVEGLVSRYAAVIHLVTAADGAEEFYTLSNNAARSETEEQARALDINTRDAWRAHSNLHVIGNGTDGFAAKINGAASIITDLISLRYRSS